MIETPLVHVVDDDSEIRRSLELLLQSVAIEVSSYASADEFLGRYPASVDRPGCVLLDVRMPGMSGMALLERLCAEHPALPVIIITGHGDIDMAVRAMKLGAADFITKPLSSQALLDRVQQVLREAAEPSAPDSGSPVAIARWQTLTPREQEVFDLIVTGAANKAIGLELGISIRTVESHRASIMEKMRARTLVDLVHLSVGLKKVHK